MNNKYINTVFAPHEIKMRIWGSYSTRAEAVADRARIIKLFAEECDYSESDIEEMNCVLTLTAAAYDKKLQKAGKQYPSIQQ